MSGAPAELGHAASPAASESLPPLVQPPTRRHEVGKIVWLDLLTPDVRAEQQFYAGLFGWRFRDLQVDSSVYAIASIDGEPVAGLLQRPLPPNMQRRPAWLPFLSVGNAEAIKQQALAHGARVISDVRDYRQRGRQAILADPQGAVFAVLQSSAGDPPDALPTPGECIWGTLFARDPAEEAGFYQALFGYEVYPLVDPPTASMVSTASSAGPAQERRELVHGTGG
jgi:predicted enzyme related to lactoylglutathione lyase